MAKNRRKTLTSVFYIVYNAVHNKEGATVSMSGSGQADKAYNILRQKLLDQHLPPGAPVVEVELANEFGMSRTPVREAIRRLHADGLLEVIPRKGTYVRGFTIHDLVKLYELAEGLEGMVAYLVAEKQSRGELASDDFAKLEECLVEMERFTDGKDYRAWADSDSAFHRTLYALSDNRFLLDTLKRVRTQLNTTLLTAISMFADLNESNREHRGIVDAIRDGDPEAAREMIQKQHHRMRGNLLRHGRTGTS